MGSALKITDGIYIEQERESLRHVNATPDEDYPIRILEAHLAGAESTCCTDNLSGAPPTNPLCLAMNEASEERARLLRQAIDALRAENRRRQGG